MTLSKKRNQHKNTAIMLIVVMLSVAIYFPNVIMLSVIVLNVVMLSVVMLNIVVPTQERNTVRYYSSEGSGFTYKY